MNSSPKNQSNDWVNDILNKCFTEDKSEFNWIALIAYTLIVVITVAIWHQAFVWLAQYF